MQEKHVLNIGFDDTDSPKGMCTTYLAFKIVDYLKKQRVDFLDYPKLIRFNPNIPWKTRGNGAVSLKISTGNPKKIKSDIKKIINRYSDIKNGANPGLVFYEESSIPKQFREFSELALHKLINRNLAKKFVAQNNLESFFRGNGQGLVGAIGAIGYDFQDHTMELLSYRKPPMFGKKRKLSNSSVKIMQDRTFPYTFNSFDQRKERVLITPRGPDPVFYGIRGENPHILLDAARMLSTDEKLDGFMIFKSNQGTNDHLKHVIDIDKLEPYSSGIVTGYVEKEPQTILGGHVLFSVLSDGKELACAIYKKTCLGTIALELIKGDRIRVGGGIRKSSKKFPRILNVEFLQVLELQQKITTSNPHCTFCNKKMKSKGKNQGFECLKCGKRSDLKTINVEKRKIKKDLYIPATSAHRHLTRPIQRIGRKNIKSTFDGSLHWFHRFDN